MAAGAGSYIASPTSLTAGPDGDNRFELSAPPGFRGPGALLVEVTTAADVNGNEDVTTTDDGVTVLLSIPVQVGDEIPDLDCPSTVIPISAGQQYDLDIANFCTVFTVGSTRQPPTLDYEAELDECSRRSRGGRPGRLGGGINAARGRARVGARPC